MRGLKYKEQLQANKQTVVASHADAWIEIQAIQDLTKSTKVASHADAWIEIGNYFGIINGDAESHPTRMRGLK